MIGAAQFSEAIQERRGSPHRSQGVDSISRTLKQNDEHFYSPVPCETLATKSLTKLSAERIEALAKELSELSDLHRKATQDARYIGLSGKDTEAYDQSRQRMNPIHTLPESTQGGSPETRVFH
jgi:hypothetical protein